MVDQLPPDPKTMMLAPPPADMPLIDRVIDALLAFKSVTSGQPRLPIEDLGPDLRRTYEAHALRLLGHIENAPPVVGISITGPDPRYTFEVRANVLAVPHFWHQIDLQAYELDRYRTGALLADELVNMLCEGIASTYLDSIGLPVANALLAHPEFERAREKSS